MIGHISHSFKYFQIISNTFKYNMIFSIVEEVFHGYDDEECLLQLLVDDIDSSPPLDVVDDDEDMEEDALDNEDPSIVLSRAFYWHRARLKWNEHMAVCCHDSTFEKKYRTSIQAFNTKLVRMFLGDSRGVQRDFRKSRHGGFVPPEIVVGCGIRYLTGDKYTALTDVFGISKSKVYVVERCDDVLFSITRSIVSLILVINSTTTNIIIATNIISCKRTLVS